MRPNAIAPSASTETGIFLVMRERVKLVWWTRQFLTMGIRANCWLSIRSWFCREGDGSKVERSEIQHTRARAILLGKSRQILQQKWFTEKKFRENSFAT